MISKIGIRGAIFLISLLLSSFAEAQTASTINPNVPAPGADVDSYTIRALALAAYNDITGLMQDHNLPAVAANQYLGTVAAGVAGPFAWPACDNSNQALIYTQGVGVRCNTFNFSGLGTVTSVGFLGDGNLYPATPTTPVTTSGNLTPGLLPHSGNSFFASPSDGSNGAPIFRPLSGADIPNPSPSVLGGIKSIAAIAHQFIVSISNTGQPVLAQPAASDVSGLAASATTDTTNAANISSGTLSASRLPSTAVTPGSYTSSNITVDATGRVTAASNGSGGGGGITALTGDVTASGSGSVVATLANNSTARTNIGLGAASAVSFGSLSLTTPLTAANGGTGVNAAQPNGTFVAINPIAGATAEYPMTDGSGTTVTDISGNGNNATFSSAPSPTWTTYGINFNDPNTIVNQYVQTPVKTWKSAIVNVCSSVVALTGTNITGASNLLVGGSFGDGLLMYANQTLGVTHSTNTFYPGIYKNTTNVLATNTLSPSKLCSNLAWVLDTSDHIYVDGQESVYTTQGASAASVTTTSTGYALGSSGPLSVNGENFIGTINYAVFFPGVLTKAQVQQEGSYINSQVYSRNSYPGNVASSLSVSPNVICIGDSLTEGSHGSVWCNSTFMTLTNTYTFLRDSIGGNSADNELAPSSGRYPTIVSHYGGKNYCHFWLGTNDVAAEGFTSTVTWAKLQYFGRQAQQNGCIPIISTMISRSGADTAKNSLNALIRANWRTAFAAMNDVAAIPALGADGAFANPVATCFFTDGIHLINTGTSCYNGLSGYPTVGWNAARVINILDGSTVDNPTITTSTAYTQNIGDNYILQTPASSATNTLIDCTGLTGFTRTITNGSGSNAITVNTSASQTITGSATVAANATAKFTCELTDPGTGGNYWLRTQ